MPDITICTNENCPLSNICWRFICPPSKYQQSYAKFEPQVDKTNCEMYFEKPNKAMWSSNKVRLTPE
jgi:hypothetical protein